MDKSTSVLAALDAGKLPSTQQLTTYIDYVLNDILPPVPTRSGSHGSGTTTGANPTSASAHPGATTSMKSIASDEGLLGKISDAMARAEDSLSPSQEGKDVSAAVDDVNQELSAQGKILAGDVKAILEAWKALLREKNSDNLLQESIYTLSQVSPRLPLSEDGSEELTKKASSQVSHDLATITNLLQTFISSLLSSLSTESSSLFTDMLSSLRLTLADAASSIAATAENTSSTLRRMEEEVQEGKRDALGLDKEALKKADEGGAEGIWEYGMDTAKDAGTGVIRGVEKIGDVARVGEKAGERGHRRLVEGLNKVADRAQKDPAYKEALDDFFKLLQARLDNLSSWAAKLDPQNSNKTSDISLSSFFIDTSVDGGDEQQQKATQAAQQKLDKALGSFKTLVERLSNTSLDPLLDALRSVISVVLKEAEDQKDPSQLGEQGPTRGGKGELKKWFEDALSFARKVLAEPGFARSGEAERQADELRERWIGLYTGSGDADLNKEWRTSLNRLQTQLAKLGDGMAGDRALARLKVAHVQFSNDLERGWRDVSDVTGGVVGGVKRDIEGTVGGVKRDVEGKVKDASGEVEQAKETTGVDVEGILGMSPSDIVQQATWFWQDLFTVYVPKVFGKLKDVSIPRTEYKDPEFEFVLENLSVSSFNWQPSHTYIRNITDIDVQASHAYSHTAVGTLTHIRIQALQLSLKDVSFWYMDKTAGVMTPSEFTGLLGVELPEKGVDVDLKVRLIPFDARGKGGDKLRKERRHFHVIEQCKVTISEDVKLEVRESNHSVLMTLFRPVVVGRVKDALERTMGEWLRGAVEWVDGVAWDVGVRREVFMDTGLSPGASLLAALWSEVGRLERHATGRTIHTIDEEDGRPRDDIVTMSLGATGTGIYAKHERRVDVDVLGEGEREKRETIIAMGAEPQVLGPEKRGPLGTGSEYLGDKFRRGVEEAKGKVVEAAGQAGVDLDVDMEDVTSSTQQAKGAAKDVAREVKNVAREVKDTAEGMVEDAKGIIGGALGEGRRELDGFRRAVLIKSEKERGREGWRSTAFDI